jgi:hypothetical protein
MKRFFNAIKKNYKTSLGGVAVLAVTAFHVSQNPLTLLNPETLAGIATGVSLIAAKDGDKTGLPEVKVTWPEKLAGIATGVSLIAAKDGNKTGLPEVKVTWPEK